MAAAPASAAAAVAAAAASASASASASTSASAAAAAVYRNAVALAPMVRAGTLPLRLLALEYGADLVFSEELIDRQVMKAQRVENAVFRSVDFIVPLSEQHREGRRNRKKKRTQQQAGQEPEEEETTRLLLRTVPALERGKLVLQLGTASPENAVRAAQVVTEHRDVVGIDVNMGCPKPFSVKGGMGAALLQTPDRAAAIVRALRETCEEKGVVVSAKIRLLETVAKTVEFAQTLAAAGAQALTVHLRSPSQSSADPAQWEALKPIVDALSIPVWANGDVYTQEAIRQVREQSGCEGVMIARPVLYNPSVFRREGFLDRYQCIQQYLRLATRYESVFQNAKYVVCEMMAKKRHTRGILQTLPGTMGVGHGVQPRAVVSARSVQELCSIFGIEDEWHALRAEIAERRDDIRRSTRATGASTAKVAAAAAATAAKRGPNAGEAGGGQAREPPVGAGEHKGEGVDGDTTTDPVLDSMDWMLNSSSQQGLVYRHSDTYFARDPALQGEDAESGGQSSGKKEKEEKLAEPEPEAEEQKSEPADDPHVAKKRVRLGS